MKSIWKVLAGILAIGILGFQYDCLVEMNLLGLPTGKILGDLRFTWLKIIPIKTFPKEHKFTKWYLGRVFPGTEFYSE